ncbi:hypothetical protein R5R35_013026 [Gryllus longicercus]|uniref:Uncharacterized protein n=1 Tax=Gryllus longicercus TaxID=2509291 RepID=A0AAN9Z0R7_9ORTH
MAAKRDRLLELLQPEPSWRRGHLFALYLRWMAFKVPTQPVFSSHRKQREMAAKRDRLLELLQPEPSWRRGHLFALYLRWMAFMGAHSGPRPRRLSPMQWAMRALIGFLHALTIYFLLGEWLELFLNSKDINDYISKAGVCLTSTCAAFNNFHAVFNAYRLRKIIDALDSYVMAIEEPYIDSSSTLSPVIVYMKKMDNIIYWCVH